MQSLRSLLKAHAEMIFIALLILLGTVLRLSTIHTPLLDWHAFRQADTASMTYEYVTKGIDLLEPTYHDISNIQSGEFNPQGFRMVEFPIINALQALVLRTFPALPFAATLRTFAVIASVAAMFALYDLVKQLSGRSAALWSLAAFVLMPFSIFYSRAVLPEPYVLAFSLISLATFVRWLKLQTADSRFSWQSWGWYFTSLVFLMLTFLLKPFIAFFAPVYLALMLYFRDWRILFDIRIWIYGLTAAAPFGAWRWWIQRYETGIPASDWLFNGDGIRFRPAWFRWLFWERITKLIWGYLGVILALGNFLRIRDRDTWVYASWWLGVIIYFSVIATGNVRHDYYQVMILPILAISMGRGAQLLVSEILHLLKEKTDFETWLRTVVSYGVVGTIFLIALWLSWTQVRGYFNTNHPGYIAAGQRVQEILPEDAIVIAPAMGDTQFLFQTRRQGWPIGFEIEDKIEKGAEYYVSANYDDETNRLLKQYKTIERTEKYIILDLTAPIASESTDSDQDPQ